MLMFSTGDGNICNEEYVEEEGLGSYSKISLWIVCLKSCLVDNNAWNRGGCNQEYDDIVYIVIFWGLIYFFQ